MGEMNKLMVCTLESRFRMYDMRTFHPTKGYANLSEQAHKSTVWCGRFLPQNRELFCTGGGNGNLNLYKYSYPAQSGLVCMGSFDQSVRVAVISKLGIQ